jgi:hypothetical protein
MAAATLLGMRAAGQHSSSHEISVRASRLALTDPIVNNLLTNVNPGFCLPE